MFLLAYRLCLLFPYLASPVGDLFSAALLLPPLTHLLPLHSAFVRLVFLFHLMMAIIRTLVRTLFFPLATPPNSSVFLSHLNILGEVIHDHFS